MKILKESKNIVANIYDKDENIIETRHFSSRKQLDDYVNTLNNLVDMTMDKELYKIKGNIVLLDVWKIIIDTNITEEKKPFIKRDAGNVEQNIATFNAMMTTGNSQCLAEALIPVDKNSDIIELPTFKKCMKEYDLGKEDLKELKKELKERAPEADLGGYVYKFRWAPGKWNRGSSRATRVIYVNILKDSKVYLITMYIKKDKGTLSPKELKEVKKLSKILKN